jgi:prepilin peptidase CpaA
LGVPWQLQIALGALFLALAISVVTDLRSRLIYNVVTFPALAVVLVCFTWAGGSEALIDCLIGLAVCAVPLLLASLRGAVGMGDVKLMALAGAAAGWPGSLAVLVYVSLAGGLQAGLWLLAAKLRGLDRPKYVPYGVAIAAGTLAAFFWTDKLLG